MLRLENALAINIEQQTDPEQTSDEIRSAVTYEGKRQTFVRQKRSGNADVDRCLQSEERNNAASEEQSEAIFGVQRDHDPANDDENKQKDHQQTDP
jgi:predicted extracellular nuclease